MTTLLYAVGAYICIVAALIVAGWKDSIALTEEEEKWYEENRSRNCRD